VNFKAILLDLDNTLYDYDFCHEEAFKKVQLFLKKNFNINFFKSKKIYNYSRHYVKKQIPLTASSHSRILYFQVMCEKLKLNTVSLNLKLNNIYWQNFLQKMKLKNFALNFLKNCKKNGLKINILTDFTLSIQLKKIKRLKIEKYISVVTSSEECTFDKPNKLIFMKAIKKLRINKKKICVIGDDFNKDIKGAMNNEIFAFWLTQKKFNEKINPKFNIVNNFKELNNKIFTKNKI